MHPSSPSTASVLRQVDSLGPPGTPVTMAEIGAAFDCAVERLDTSLDRLVSHRTLKVKQVGDHRRVWWRPAGRAVDPPDVGERQSDRQRGRRGVTDGSRPTADGHDGDRLHSLVFNQPVQFTGVLDPDGTLIDANESALRFGGLSRDDVVGRPVWETDWWRISTQTQRRLQDAVGRAAAGDAVRYEVTVRGSTRTVPFDFSLRPVTDDGEVTLLIAEGRDISELKDHELQFQQERDELESELSAVLDRVSDGVYSLDSQFRFQYINDRAKALLGVDDSTARGADIRETVETTARFRTALETAADTQTPVYFEDYYKPLDGWFDNAVYPSETGVSIYFRDITERKRLERELRTETEHFQTVLRNSPVVAFRLDTDLRYTWIGNPQEDFSAAEVLGKRDDELLSPEDAAAVLEPKQTVLETGEGLREEVTLDLPRGEVVYDLTIEPIFDTAGEITGLTATAVDRTEQTRTRDALRKSEEQLRFALRTADIGTWEVDLRTMESPVHSAQHDHIFGYDEPVDWSHAVFLDHVHPDDRAAVEASFEAAFETGVWAFECRIRRADGVQRWIVVEGAFHTDTDGEPSRAVGVVRDITDRKTRQRRELATLDHLYETVQDIAHLVIGSSTQADIEQVVCDRFDAAEAYTAAWVGRLDHTGPTIRPSTAGGDDDGQPVGCAAHPIPVDPEALTISGPIAAAIETGEVQLIHTCPTDPIYRQWSQSTPIRHRPGIVVPIRYETHVYGIVVIYTDRDGFEPREQETLGRLGRIVGHAINSIERKRALTADRATEVVVRSAALAEPFVAAADDETMTISIDRVVTLRGGRSLLYYTVTGIAPEQFSAIIERLSGGEVRLLEQLGTRSRLELSTEANTIHSVVASHGGWLTEAALREGCFEITIRIPLGTAVRSVLTAARTVYPDLRLVSQTTVTPSTRTPTDVFGTFAEELTDRQREALEVGYYAGFFEWPRETSGDELAELMGVTPATVHHHLRHGQQKLLSAFFDQPSQ